MRVKLDYAACLPGGIIEQIPTISVARVRPQARAERSAQRRADCPLERLDDAGNARSDQCLRARWSAQGRGTRAPEVMTNAPLQQYNQGIMEFARRVAAAFRRELTARAGGRLAWWVAGFLRFGPRRQSVIPVGKGQQLGADLS